MRLGYARVSTADQDPAGQIRELEQAGCDRVWSERRGAGQPRPVLDEVLDHARPGDQLVVVRLDRLGRSVRQLLALADQLDRAGVELVSLRDQLDTSTPTGRLVFHVLAALAEMERELIRERTRAGMAAMRSRGKPQRKLTPARLATARRLVDEGSTITAAADEVGVHRVTLSRALSQGG